MTITTDQIHGLTGKVFAQDSDKIGSIGDIYLDDATGAPSWVTVKTGLFGTSESFVPLEGSRADGNDIFVAFTEQMIKDAPRVDPDGSLSPQEENQLYEYYGLAATNSQSGYDQDPAGNAEVPTGYVDNSTTTPVTTDHSADTAGTIGHDTSGPTTDDAMTVSEERLDVGTASRESGRARLRKYVTTENVTQTVPVRHDEVRLEREPITDANYDASQAGPAISEEEHEVVLHEEVPVVDKDVVAVERVKLGTETVVDEATVSEDVRKENVELVDPDESTRKH